MSIKCNGDVCVYLVLLTVYIIYTVVDRAIKRSGKLYTCTYTHLRLGFSWINS